MCYFLLICVWSTILEVKELNLKIENKMRRGLCTDEFKHFTFLLNLKFYTENKSHIRLNLIKPASAFYFLKRLVIHSQGACLWWGRVSGGGGVMEWAGFLQIQTGGKHQSGKGKPFIFGVLCAWFVWFLYHCWCSLLLYARVRVFSLHEMICFYQLPDALLCHSLEWISYICFLL